MTDTQDVKDITIPNNGRHFIVEFPGYVGNEQAVLDTLGGLDGISRQLQDNAAVLPLKLRPGDPYCHPIQGERQRTSCILLKLSQNNNNDDDDDETTTNCQVQAVASVDAVYKFTSPADYQYLGRDLRPPEARALIDHPTDNGIVFESGPTPFLPLQPLFSSPPLFAKQPEFDYAFGSSLQDGKGGSNSNRERKFSISIGFFTPATEVPPPLDPTKPPEVRAPLRTLQQQLLELLNQRPIWTGSAIHAAAPQGTTRQSVDELMPKLCYRFKNGPWKHAWVRKGYDPRRKESKDDARQYQVLEYQLPSEWYERISKQKQATTAEATPPTVVVKLPPLATSFNQLTNFTAVPSTHSTFLQLCDIQDDVVKGILHDERNDVGEACSDATGWLKAAAWESLRKQVKARFLAVLETSTSDDGNEQQQPTTVEEAVPTTTTITASKEAAAATEAATEAAAVDLQAIQDMLAGLSAADVDAAATNQHPNTQQESSDDDDDRQRLMGQGTGYSTDEAGGITDQEDAVGFDSEDE